MDPDVQVVYEHLHRYLWAARLVEGKRVLDLGSGEGFGASILADTAEEVVGVDVDERTVDHARLNWARPHVSFQLGSALDLSAFADGSFDAVVAFEIIEHLNEQERMLAEIWRVLSSDGVLIISTPDRRIYSEASGQDNPFHEHELTAEEFSALLETTFTNVAIWGQRAITGSHLGALDDSTVSAGASQTEFFIERAGEEWRIAGEPTGLYLVALASNGALPDVASASTLGDCGLELVRAAAFPLVAERDESLERERVARGRMAEERRESDAEIRRRDAEIRRRAAELADRDEYLRHREHEIAEMRSRLRGSEAALADLHYQLRGSAFHRPCRSIGDMAVLSAHPRSCLLRDWRRVNFGAGTTGHAPTRWSRDEQTIRIVQAGHCGAGVGSRQRADQPTGV